MSREASGHTNRLIFSSSPYLLQHAGNPVDWYPWGEEALERAKAEDKPILLSIGYAACHWCHVMERESFENEEIAALMNESFVCVKVDREERPDLDDIYMAATLAMNRGQGGWPMTVFLTPDQEPFFAGTYFPPEDRYGRPGFRNLLGRIAELWRTKKEHLREEAGELAEHLRRTNSVAPGARLDESDLRRALSQLSGDFDERFGGFGGAPKFPPATALMLLLRCHRRFGDEKALAMARKTLDEMGRGGMYDQIGGGFHRYSVDVHWLVPHFEKMLYDNGLLARAYLEAYQATGEASYGRTAAEILDYVLREMTSPEGAFYSSTDADSEGEEGKFFVWTPEEIEAILGEEDARVFCTYYDIGSKGNWEGRSIPNTSRTGERVAKSLNLEPEALEQRIAALRPRVYEARRTRIPPGLDDKVLTAWNGLMISALAEGGRVLRRPSYVAAAERAASFLLSLRTPEGRLRRSYRDGAARIDAYLEDYALLAEACIDLYEAGASERFLREAAALAEIVRQDFADEAGGFFTTSRQHEDLILRPREGHDGAIPSANAVAAHVLARLSYHLDRETLRNESVAALRAWGRAIARQPRAFAKSLLALDLLLDGPLELALVGRAGDEGLEALRDEVARHFLPNRIIALHDPSLGPPALPLLQDKDLVQGKAALYVCREFACQTPVTRAEEVAAALASAPAPAAAASALASHRLPGHATSEATAAFAARHAHAGYAPLGGTDLTCSRVGFGGYRVDDETQEHREALKAALVAGCNVVDTSTNYTDGGSERLIGEVVRALTASGSVKREEIVVVSKIGYVQGSNLELAEEREAEGRPFPDMVKYAEGVWHCIHPEFLEDQLERSLDRLGLETLDVCLLHNPEYFLKDAHERSYLTLAKRRDAFYQRLGHAFAWLESQVNAGKLLFYGVSSNSCTAAADDPEATSLSLMQAAARATAGPEHHFRVLQLPLNLLEAGAVLERNEGERLDRTVLDVAIDQGIGVLVNRPLNAFTDDGLWRLAEVDSEPASDFGASLDAVTTLEEEFRARIAPHLEAAEGGASPQMFFAWAQELPSVLAQVRSVDHWNGIESQRILPRLFHVVQALDRSLGGERRDEWRGWRARYLPALQQLLSACRHRASEKSRAALARITAALDPLLPQERRGETLSRKALWVVASTPGVGSVLCGMRKTAYVEDAMGILSWPPLTNAGGVYRAMAHR
jgi:uncharacterized protein YyaL (SSP411 family)/aryl-alcohol dehydrogenase-like predicted oxidoreductase